MIAVVLGVNFSLDALLNAGYDGGLVCGQCRHKQELLLATAKEQHEVPLLSLVLSFF
jgi:hypothetical protein